MIQNKKMFPQKYCCDIQYKVVPPQLFIVLLFYIPDYWNLDIADRLPKSAKWEIQ